MTHEGKPSADPQRPRIVLHLGLPKAGSTTVQSMLRENRALFGPGVAISARDRLTRPLRHVARAYMRQGGPLRAMRLRLNIARVVRAIRRMEFETLILSDENMLGTESAYMFARDNAADYRFVLDRLRDGLADYDLRFVVHMRARERWRRSSYNQSVKRGKHTLGFDEWAAANDDEEGPDRIVAAWRESLGDRLEVLDMESEIGPGTFLGRRVLEVAGLSPDLIAQVRIPQPQNESLPSGALEFIRRVNSEPLLCWGSRRRLRRVIRDNPELFAGSSGPRRAGAGTSA